MDKDFEYLDNIRIEISQSAGEARVLFDKIKDSDTLEIFYLTDIGVKVCKEIIKNAEKLEAFLSKK